MSKRCPIQDSCPVLAGVEGVERRGGKCVGVSLWLRVLFMTATFVQWLWMVLLLLMVIPPAMASSPVLSVPYLVRILAWIVAGGSLGVFVLGVLGWRYADKHPDVVEVYRQCDIWENRLF